MKAFKIIAMIPTALSLFLTITFTVVSIHYNPPFALHWTDDLRDALFFLMQSEMLLLVVGAIIHVTGTKPDSRLRALTAGQQALDCMNSVESVRDKCRSSQSFFLERLSERVDKFLEDLATLERGTFESTPEEIEQWTRELYRLSKQICSVSMIDVRRYWEDPRVGTVAMQRNQEARNRGVSIERIFIFQRHQEILACLGLLREMHAMGVNLSYVLLNEIPEDCRVDFSIYDDRQVQYFEFDKATFNKVYSECTISVDEHELDRFRKILKKLCERSKPIDPSSFEPTSADNQSLWHSAPFRTLYDGKPPELHLEKITTHCQNVLDVGCGSGRILKLFGDHGCTVTGVDSDSTAIDMCREHFKNAPVTLINKAFSPELFEGQTFDLVVAYNSIYHCKKEQLVTDLKGISELLKPGGYLLLTLKTSGNNAEATKGGVQIEPNTWIGCNMPDYWAIHHFCTDEEIAHLISLIGELVYREEIPIIKENGVIVQAAGIYMILRRIAIG